MSESEKDVYSSNEDEYLTDMFQTEDNGGSGKCKVNMILAWTDFWTVFDSFSNSFSTLFLTFF